MWCFPVFHSAILHRPLLSRRLASVLVGISCRALNRTDPFRSGYPNIRNRYPDRISGPNHSEIGVGCCELTATPSKGMLIGSRKGSVRDGVLVGSRKGSFKTHMAYPSRILTDMQPARGFSPRSHHELLLC
eukprot:jgi/Botrbrau1/9602/Bobra.106_2s0024.1